MIKDRIRELRRELGLTQEELAAKLHVRAKTVSAWERGVNNPSPLALEFIQSLEGKTQ